MISSEEVRSRIRKVFDYVTESILNGEPPHFDGLLDVKSSSEASSFDFTTFRLSLNPDKIKTMSVTMLGHSQHFSKLLTLMEFIDSQLESQGEGKMNKRAIYYHHKDKAIETQGELDQYIGEICQIVGVTRDDLRIVRFLKLIG